MELFGEVCYEFLHNGLNLLVVECFLLILQNEVHGIALFTSRQVLPFVDIEQFNTLEKFLLSLSCNLFYLGKLNTLVV